MLTNELLGKFIASAQKKKLDHIGIPSNSVPYHVTDTHVPHLKCGRILSTKTTNKQTKQLDMGPR